MLPEFELLMPRSLGEALGMLAQRTQQVKPLAGGTNVLVELREGRHRYPILMDVSRLRELRGITKEDGRMVVGGATTIAELLADPLIAQFGAPLQQAAAVLGSPLVRNRATLAGNLVDASPAADTAPPLLALRAEVELMSQTVSRRIPLDDFLVGPNQTLRRPQELVVAIHWPTPGPRTVGFFTKIGLRRALACSIVSAAVVIEAEPSGRCADARIALGAVAPRPTRAREAEELLQGRTLTPEVIAEAAHVASEVARPIDDVRSTSAYRKRMVEVLVRRLLVASAESLQTLPAKR